MSYAPGRAAQIDRYEHDQRHILTLEQWAALLEGIDPSFPEGYHSSDPPLAPTDAEPGSPAKQIVLRQRYLRRQNLHHRQDRQQGEEATGAS